MVEDGFDTSSLEKMYQDLLKGEASFTEVNDNDCIIAISKIIENFKSELSSKSRTAKLWIQYLEYINIIKLFIRAERTGNWNEHLEAMRLMLNLFAATGHIKYAKSARLYLQSMQSLHADHPWLYDQYCKSGYHCIRRSDRFWAGLWPDLVIEQCMMRAIKSSGGLTRGRGMTESTRNLWVGTLHECASIHESMAKLTKHRFESSQQHCESGEARRKRDGKDVEALKDQLKQHNPFDCQDSRLQCIFTGVAGDIDDGVNCDQAEKVGSEIQGSLDDIIVNKASIKRSKQVKTLAPLLPAVKINGDSVHVDPNILFQRLIMLIDRTEDMTNCFEYELTPEPTSLFKDGLMRKPNKAILGRTLIKESSILKEKFDGTTYVLDGGALLHRVCWNLPATCSKIVDQYSSYVKRKYGNEACIVFDGYVSASTKDHEHQRRGVRSADIVFKPSTQVNCKQSEFLSNSKNKAALIKELSKRFRMDRHMVVECEGDADKTIASKGIEMAKDGKRATVVADDTDILVLLVYMWEETMSDLFLRHEAKKSIKKHLEIINIKNVASKLALHVKENLLFIHAWGGCDTTSATFGQGKTGILKFVESNSNFSRNVCSVSKDPFATKAEVSKAGIQVAVKLFGIVIWF